MHNPIGFVMRSTVLTGNQTARWWVFLYIYPLERVLLAVPLSPFSKDAIFYPSRYRGSRNSIRAARAFLHMPHPLIVMSGLIFATFVTILPPRPSVRQLSLWAYKLLAPLH